MFDVSRWNGSLG